MENKNIEIIIIEDEEDILEDLGAYIKTISNTFLTKCFDTIR